MTEPRAQSPSLKLPSGVVFIKKARPMACLTRSPSQVPFITLSVSFFLVGRFGSSKTDYKKNYPYSNLSNLEDLVEAMAVPSPGHEVFGSKPNHQTGQWGMGCTFEQPKCL